MNLERIVALVGRRDEPTDGVVDYCFWLGGAIKAHGYQLETVRVPWAELGWQAALAEIRQKSAAWRDRWVLLQFTNLAWSRRGFPWHTPQILKALQENRVRCGIVFHDFAPLTGRRLIDRARQYCQLRVLQSLYEQAACAIFPVPLEMISWLPPRHEKAVFIPVGANCPEPSPDPQDQAHRAKTIAIYSVTGGAHMRREIADIGVAVKRACQRAGPLRLVVFGRGSTEADSALRAEFAGTDVDVQTLGLLTPENASLALVRADVQLFVRGQISSRRGSAIAGIACGLPVVCYEGPETGWPITEAGILSVPLGDTQGLSVALERILTDETLRVSLAGRSRFARAQYFSWPAIAAQFSACLRKPIEADNRAAALQSASSARTR